MIDGANQVPSAMRTEVGNRETAGNVHRVPGMDATIQFRFSPF